MIHIAVPIAEVLQGFMAAWFQARFGREHPNRVELCWAWDWFLDRELDGTDKAKLREASTCE